MSHYKVFVGSAVMAIIAIVGYTSLGPVRI